MLEIQIIHDEKIHIDNGFTVRILKDNEETSVLELETNEILHIGAILLNAARKFINIPKSTIKQYFQN